MKKKVITIVVVVVIVFLLILLVLPESLFENLRKGKDIEEPEVISTEEYGGGMPSSDTDIEKSTEVEEKSSVVHTEPYAVSDYSKVDSPYAYVEREKVDTNNIDLEAIDISNLNFEYHDYEQKGFTAGKNASLDLFKSILVPENMGYVVEVSNLVFLKQVDSQTYICRLSKNDNTIVIIHNCNSDLEDLGLSYKEQGHVFAFDFVIDNTTIQKMGNDEVIVTVYQNVE